MTGRHAIIEKKKESLYDEMISKKSEDTRPWDRRDIELRWLSGKSKLLIYIRDLEKPIYAELLEWGMFGIVIKIDKSQEGKYNKEGKKLLNEILYIPKHSIDWVVINQEFGEELEAID